MPIPLLGYAIGAGLSALSTYLGGRNQAKAEDAQAAANTYAADLDFQAKREALAAQIGALEQQQENNQPWLDTGKEALGRLRGLMTPGGELDQGFAPPPRFDPSQVRMDPGFDFRMSEARKAIEAAAAAKGNALSPSTLREIARYSENLASDEYGKAYGRAASEYDRNFTNDFNVFQSNQGGKFNRLAALSGVGQTAVNQLGGAERNYANNASNIIESSGARQGQLATNLGETRASGYGQRNEIANGGLSNALKLLGGYYGGG